MLLNRGLPSRSWKILKREVGLHLYKFIRMKKLLLFVVMCIFASCNTKILEETYTPVSDKPQFYASIENESSRTFIDDAIRLRWTKEDLITIFEGSTRNKMYKFLGATGDNAGEFEDVTVGFGTGNTVDCFYALYPYSSSTKLNEDGYLTYIFPKEQMYAKNSFGKGANPMVAVTNGLSDFDLVFRNVCGYLRLFLYGNDVTIKSIKVEGREGEPIAGEAFITPVYGDAPIVEMSEKATPIVTLICEEGVKLGNSDENATPFWIVLPQTTFKKGFSVTITDANGCVFTKTFHSVVSIERNKYLSASVEVKPDIPYLTFSADEEQTFTMSNADITFEYSVNNGEWKQLATSTVYFGAELGELRLRGKNSNGTASNDGKFSQIQFGAYSAVYCRGDIRTLLDYENFSTIYTGNAKFNKLFSNCICLVSAPDLPSTILAEYCYAKMFKGCSSLKFAPMLPATTLSSGCYESMFYDCSSLKSTPELPATNLAESCYFSMFDSCSNLQYVSDLPAQVLASDCYTQMFRDCTNLAYAPELPAVTLADECYNCMFYGCSSLLSAPELPAQVLAEGCYSHMFNGCVSLTEAPSLPATTLQVACYRYMFAGTSLMFGPNLTATKLANDCYRGMFYNCSYLVSAPELPATTLYENCYRQMFALCTSLQKAPELPAKSTVDYCYYEMFKGCSNLSYITMLATNYNYIGFYNWVKEVASNGTFVKDINMNSLPQGDYGIPLGWTVEDCVN